MAVDLSCSPDAVCPRKLVERLGEAVSDPAEPAVVLPDPGL
jgi:hypothetical protein